MTAESNDKPAPLPACLVGEATGTFLLVFIGCGAVHTAVTTGSMPSSWQVGSVWGLAVCLSVYLTAALSGAHINPAITLCLAVWQGFPKRRVLPYWGAQLAGAALAAFCLHLIFAGTIEAFETREGILRGEPGSEVTAAMYGEYFPNPTVPIHGAGTSAAYGNLSVPAAMLAEIIATAILALAVLGLTDPRNRAAPPSKLAPFFIGATVAVLVALFGPMTQACLNPARDFGPRIVAALSGWGSIAFPGPNGAHGVLLVYLVAPLTGGVVGGLVYARVLSPLQERCAGDADA